MKCKHGLNRHYEPWDNIHSRTMIVDGKSKLVTVFICWECKEWLSLGDANDTPAVFVEIRAAEIAATLADALVPQMNDCQKHGWEVHANGDPDHQRFPILCVKSDFDAGYLARCIVEHQETIAPAEVSQALQAGARVRQAAERMQKRRRR